MSSVRIIYSSAQDAWKAADKAASYCDDYADKIRRNVTTKLGNLKGGSSGYTSNAAGYASSKINELHAKASSLRTYSNRLQALYREAKNRDRNVQSYLKLEGRDFRDSHDMHVSKVTEFFVNFFVVIGNSNPVYKWIKDSFTAATDWMSEKWQDIKYWYKCEGGRYVIKIVAAFALIIVAVVALVVAWPVMIAAISTIIAGTITLSTIWAATVAVASFVGAIIAIADALIDFEYNIVALTTFGSDPAWAARYDSYDSLSNWLRNNRFSSSWMNKWSYTYANVVSSVKTVCALIKFTDLMLNSAKFFEGVKEGKYWSKSKSAYKAVKSSDATAWTKAKYMVKSVYTDYKQITSVNASMYSQLKAYYGSADYLGKTLKGFYDATKTIKTISKFIIKFDEKGIVKAVVDYGRGKTTYIKEGYSTYKDIKGSLESYQKFVQTSRKVNVLSGSDLGVSAA